MATCGCEWERTKTLFRGNYKALPFDIILVIVFIFSLTLVVGDIEGHVILGHGQDKLITNEL